MAYFALVVCTVIWGATFPATKIVLTQVPPLTFLFLRFFLGTLLVLGLLFVLQRSWRADRSTARMGAIATVFLFVGYVAQTVGLQYTTASNSAFITAMYVVFVPLILRRFDRRTWLAAGLALIGLLFLVNPTLTINRGDIWTLVCAVGFAAYIAAIEDFSRRGGISSLVAWQMLFMTSTMGVAMALESPEIHQLQPTPELMIALLICGVFATGALWLQIWAQRFVPAHRVALIFIMEPVFAALMAWYVLHEQLTLKGWLGSALILAAVFIGSVERTAPQAVAPARRPVGG